MNWMCRLFGHALNEGSGPSERHGCRRDWGPKWHEPKGCDWCTCKQHGCHDCHGRDYIPPPAYLWCVQRGGSGVRDEGYGLMLRSWPPRREELTPKQIAYLKDFNAKYPAQLHPKVREAIDAL